MSKKATRKYKIDFDLIEKKLVDKNMNEQQLYLSAKISKSTYYKIKEEEDKLTTWPICCAIAHVLGIAPEELEINTTEPDPLKLSARKAGDTLYILVPVREDTRIEDIRINGHKVALKDE